MGLLDLLLPTRCVVCAAPGPEVCPGCSDGLPRLSPPLCHRCGTPTAWPVARCRECSGRRLAFASARAAVVYDDRVASVLRAWKDQGLRDLCELAAELVVFQIEKPDAFALTFVPPDGDRTLRRGHHPAQRLAGAVGRRWGIPVEPLLARTRHVQAQRGLPLAARRRNVRGAFTATAGPGRVVVVDDVYTSGSTVNAAASALRKAGSRRVEVVTFARALR